MLINGSVEVRLQLGGDRYQRLDVFSAGMSFGELAFLDGSPRSADIVAMAPVDCRVIDRRFYNALGEQIPTLESEDSQRDRAPAMRSAAPGKPRSLCVEELDYPRNDLPPLAPGISAMPPIDGPL